MRIGIDIDDTITRCPEFFALISRALVAGGHEVYVISYREGQEAVRAELGGWGIAYSDVVLPTNEELDNAGFYEWKVQTCRRLKIDVLFEDMPEVINRLDDSVVAFMPYDADLGQVTYQDTQ